MTREEAIKVLEAEKKFLFHGSLSDKHYEPAFDIAIEALQEQKTGEWKEVYAESDYRDGWIEFTCENCECQHGLESGQYGWYYGDDIPWKYCPLCGAKMKGEEDD